MYPTLSTGIRTLYISGSRLLHHLQRCIAVPNDCLLIAASTDKPTWIGEAGEQFHEVVNYSDSLSLLVWRTKDAYSAPRDHAMRIMDFLNLYQYQLVAMPFDQTPGEWAQAIMAANPTLRVIT